MWPDWVSNSGLYISDKKASGFQKVFTPMKCSKIQSRKQKFVGKNLDKQRKL